MSNKTGAITFARCFRETRKELNLTLAETAKVMGVSPSLISDVERGSRLPFQLRYLNRLATVFPADRFNYLKDLCLKVRGPDFQEENQVLKLEVSRLSTELFYAEKHHEEHHEQETKVEKDQRIANAEGASYEADLAAHGACPCHFTGCIHDTMRWRFEKAGWLKPHAS